MVNEFLDAVIEHGGTGASNLGDLVAAGEGPDLEFKETARYNTRTGQADKVLEAVVVKTVAGFLNAHGGTLVIGVTDAGRSVGLEPDLSTISKGTLDGFQLFLRTLLNGAIGADLVAKVGIEFPSIDTVEVCALRVPAAPRPVWVTSGNERTFYVRSGNQTLPLAGEQEYRYIANHWGN